jgi:ubiquinone/menaquinone biosynthesis C-methylase UbiE
MDKATDSYKYYLERVKLYKSFGYDIEKERSFVFSKAKPFEGAILEVGTGKGYFAILLAKEGYRFTSIDISQEEQNYAKSILRHLNLERFVDFRIEDAEKLSFKDESFDVIFSINTLHHMSNPKRSIDEMIRLVSATGKIVLSDFTEEGFKLIGKIHETERREHAFPKDNLNAVVTYLKTKGFNIDRYETDYQETVMAHHQHRKQ